MALWRVEESDCETWETKIDDVIDRGQKYTLYMIGNMINTTLIVTSLWSSIFKSSYREAEYSVSHCEGSQSRGCKASQVLARFAPRRAVWRWRPSRTFDVTPGRLESGCSAVIRPHRTQSLVIYTSLAEDVPLPERLPCKKIHSIISLKFQDIVAQMDVQLYVYDLSQVRLTIRDISLRLIAP